MLRMIMTEELILEEAKHEEIELTCIWPAVRGQIPGGDQLADRATCAELEIVALLAELNQVDVSRPEFEKLLKAFTQAAREHFDFEERQVWPRLRSVLTAKATDELAGRILTARQAVPVPPFPRASASSS
jgi:hypothetical protein